MGLSPPFGQVIINPRLFISLGWVDGKVCEIAPPPCQVLLKGRSGDKIPKRFKYFQPHREICCNLSDGNFLLHSWCVGATHVHRSFLFQSRRTMLNIFLRDVILHSLPGCDDTLSPVYQKMLPGEGNKDTAVGGGPARAGPG